MYNTMAEAETVPLPKNKSKNRALGWLTVRRSRSKNKYSLHDAIPHSFIHPDDRPYSDLIEEEDDIPKLTERLRSLECDNSYFDPLIVITTQKHLIDALRRENGALRLLKHQVAHLRQENMELKKTAGKSQLKKSRSKKEQRIVNGVTDKNTTNKLENGSKVESRTVKTGSDGDGSCESSRSNGSGDILEINGWHRSSVSDEDLVSLRMENERLQKSNEHLQSCLEEQAKHSGGPHGETGSNGCRLSNGASAEDDNERRSLSDEGTMKRTVLKRGNDTGAGTSGTSLVTVSCLRKAEGTFHNCEEILEERLKSHMAAKGIDLVLKEWSPGRDHHTVTLVFCLASNDIAKNVMKALDGVSTNAEVVLVVFHTASQEVKRKDPETEGLNLVALSNACLVVDMFFSKKDSLYRCNQNNKAMSRLLNLFEMIC